MNDHSEAPKAIQGPMVDAADGADQDQDPMLSLEDVAREVGLKPRAIRRAISDGELAACKLRGRIRIARSNIDAWKERNAIRPKQPQPCHTRPPIRRAGADGGLRRLLFDDAAE
jgi:excisionase family DNA binding protein